MSLPNRALTEQHATMNVIAQGASLRKHFLVVSLSVRLKPITKSPLSYKEDKGLLPLEWGLDSDHYQLSSNDTPVGNVSRGTSTQRREQVP